MSATFHLFLPQMRMSFDTMLERARAAEDSGFEGIALMDHLAPPLATEHDMWESMVMATWLLAHTDRLKVGHLVLCDSLRHPALLARQAVSLDHASDGRFELGIGWGSVPEELEIFGVGSADPKVRVGRLAESLDVIRALWTGEPVTYSGQYFQLQAAQQRPVPRHGIPILIGGVGRRTLDLVRRHADWWNVPVHEVSKLEAARAEAGTARVSAQWRVALLEREADRAEVTALAQRRFGAVSVDAMLIGTAPQLIERFGELAGRGIERFYVWFADFAPPPTLQGFAQVVAGLH